ncbi:MAG: RecQ family ATP-dependent DNA helicase [Chitinophagales bacterium]|nr:RecQ family ATP-dependent DNA helicase [Chitinophagaceae bacterium]MCB9064253.1 RecQ family ATP-dependent DNA helicase [Chitinophagales bacterium]
MQQLVNILHDYWGHKSFRPLQLDVINSLLEGNDTLAILPTGGGKSICYQLPAVVNSGLTLVISPLVALMSEQVEVLNEKDISAALITSTMHPVEIKRTLNNAVEGAYKLLYISPERLQSDLFNEYLPALDISLVAVDEAHCISQWGHDFRPSYLNIGALKKLFRNTPFLAVTASALSAIEADIIKQLHFNKHTIFKGSLERKNITYTITYTENKIQNVLDLLSQQNTSNIIYCRSRRQTEQLAKALQQHGIEAIAYHAGMNPEQRANNQKAWTDGSNTIVATTAFGMGIDKSNVRLVIHYDVPEHLEAYYQETGRAGRDGEDSSAIMLYNQSDLQKLKDSTSLQFPHYEYIRQVYQSVVEYLQIPIGAEPYRNYDFELIDFCNKFDLKPLQASRALKLLEQDGLWILSDAVFSPPTIQMLADRHELDNIGKAYPDLNLVITTLLRLYGSLYHQPTKVNLLMVAKHLKIKVEVLTAILRNLDRMEALIFNEPKKGPQLFFNHYRVDSKHLLLNTERINALKQAHEQRTKAMMEYIISDDTCRTKVLLHYFGEEKTDNCRHCDYCLNNHSSTTITKAEIMNLFSEKAEINITDINAQFPKVNSEDISDTIRQLIDDNILGLKPNNVIFKK